MNTHRPATRKACAGTGSKPARRSKTGTAEAAGAVAWQSGFVFGLHGVSIGFETNLPRIAELVLGRLPPGSRLEEGAEPETVLSLIVNRQDTSRQSDNILLVNERIYTRDPDIGRLLDLVEDLFRLEVSYWADDEHIFVHAGVVTHAGMAVVLPGRSGSGKTTLVSALLDEGAAYCSDEMAVIDRAGRVHPFPTPLAIRRDGQDTKQRVPVDEGRLELTPRKIGLVMALRHDPGLRSWRPRRLAAAQAVIELLDHTVAARRLPKPAMARFSMVFRNAPAFRGRRADAAATAKRIMSLVESLAERPADVA